MRTLLLCLFLSSTVASAGELRLSPNFSNADLFRSQYATLFSGLSRVLVNDVPLEPGFCTSFDDACRSKVWNYARMVDLRQQLTTFLMIDDSNVVFSDSYAISAGDSDAMFHAYRTLERWMSVLNLPPFNLERNRLRLADYLKFIYFADRRLPTHARSDYQQVSVTRLRARDEDEYRRFARRERSVERHYIRSEREELRVVSEYSDLFELALSRNPARRLGPLVMVPDHLSRIQIREILNVLLDFATAKDEYGVTLGCHALSTRECAEISEDFAPHLQLLLSVGLNDMMFSGRGSSIDLGLYAGDTISVPVGDLVNQGRDSRSEALGDLAVDVANRAIQRRPRYE